MRKGIALLLALLCAFTLTGCGGEKVESSPVAPAKPVIYLYPEEEMSASKAS